MRSILSKSNRESRESDKILAAKRHKIRKNEEAVQKDWLHQGINLYMIYTDLLFLRPLCIFGALIL
jgi:hypothetical protein